MMKILSTSRTPSHLAIALADHLRSRLSRLPSDAEAWLLALRFIYSKGFKLLAIFLRSIGLRFWPKMPFQMDGGILQNGAHTVSHGSEANGMALTEYATNPSPPSPHKSSASSQVPAAFLLPDGLPDVS